MINNYVNTLPLIVNSLTSYPFCMHAMLCIDVCMLFVYLIIRDVVNEMGVIRKVQE